MLKPNATPREAMSSIYYSAAWTECGCLVCCWHEHKTVREAATCIPCAGGYVVGVKNGVMRSLSAGEEGEFQCAIRAPHSNDSGARGAGAARKELAMSNPEYAVMTQIRLVDRRAWTTWMRFDTYAEAAADAREGDKVVRLRSAEWAALVQTTEPVLPTLISAPAESLLPRGENEALLEFVLRCLSGYGFGQPPSHSSNRTRELAEFQRLGIQRNHIWGTGFDEQTATIEEPIDIVDRVLRWLGEWEIRELESMYIKRVPVWLEALRDRFHSAIERKASKQFLVAEHMVKPLSPERRFDSERRRRVAEMSPEELQRELLTSDVTGLPNRRAFDEAAAAPAVGMSDVDGLKALNDQYGYEAGNALLKAKAAALRHVGLEAYHDKGDEFLYRGASNEELQANLERASAILRERTIVVEKKDGPTLRFAGADFSHGVGKDMDEAEFRLKSHKAKRKARGELERGELRGIIKREKPEGAVPHRH